MKKQVLQLIFLLSALFAVKTIHAQTEPSYRQYKFNALTLNPAQAGANPYSDISAIGTQYWVGMPGAPVTSTLSANFRLQGNFGAGGTVIFDQTGPARSTSVNLIGASHLKVSKNWKVSAGLKISALNYTVNTAELETTTANDPDMMHSITTGLSLNAGFGFLVYSKKMYAGFSVPRVSFLRFDETNMGYVVDKRGGYISYAGVNLDLGRDLELRPSVLAIYGYAGPVSLDINAIVTAYEFIDLGVTYHVNGSIGAIAGLTIKDRFYIGYAYTYPLNAMHKVSIQSHEIGLRFMFNKAVQTTSPRFFN
jgi:type IX secretion system PorP/SprF family membrane protein